MKNRFFKYGIFLFSIIFTACSFILDDKKSSSSDSNNYGSLSISSSARELNISNISSAVITVSGDDFNNEISETCDFIKDGCGSVYIEKIPIGKNRIVTVTAYDNSSVALENAVLTAVVDINSGVNTIDTINRSTSYKGNVYKSLLNRGEKISNFTQSIMKSLDSIIPSSEDCDLDRVDVESIVQDFKSNSLKNIEDYILPITAYLKRLRITQSKDSCSEKPLFSAVAIYSDGQEYDVTDKASWISSNETVATIKNGNVTLISKGNTEIYAKYTDTTDLINRTSSKASLDVSVVEANNNYIYLGKSSSVEYTKANAVIAAWIWGNGLSSQWYEFESVDNNYVRVKLPAGSTGMIIARGSYLSNETTWAGLKIWNKTADLSISSKYNTFIPSSWDNSTSNWSYIDHGDVLVDYVYADITMEPSIDDTSLATLSVNGTLINILSSIYTIPYESESATIEATANYSEATVEIKPSNIASISVGESVSFVITVKAKDGNTEDYKLKIKRSPIIPINSDKNKKCCYIEDVEEKTITFVYSLDKNYWNDNKDSINNLSIRGSFTTMWNNSMKKWVEDSDSYTLSYDSNYNWYSVTLPYEKVKAPGYSGQPEFRFFKNDKCLDIPSFVPSENVFKNDSNNMMILFESDDEQRIAEIKENSDNAIINKPLKDFNLSDDSDLHKISNFRQVPGTSQLYRSYHPYYPSHCSCDTERARIETIQSFATSVGIKSDINLCNDRSPKVGNTYFVNGIEYTVTIPQYYNNIINNNSVLYVGDSEHCGNGVIPSGNHVYYNSNSKLFGEWINEIVSFINSHEAPFQIHCEIGVDRTGVFCAVLSGLCGSSWDDIVSDYKASNNMQINEFRDVKLLTYSLQNMLNIDDISAENDLASILKNYFVQNGYVTQNELNTMIEKLKS